MKLYAVRINVWWSQYFLSCCLRTSHIGSVGYHNSERQELRKGSNEQSTQRQHLAPEGKQQTLLIRIEFIDIPVSMGNFIIPLKRKALNCLATSKYLTPPRWNILRANQVMDSSLAGHKWIYILMVPYLVVLKTHCLSTIARRHFDFSSLMQWGEPFV